MSCSTIDLKAYLFGEANGREKAAAEDHIHVCQSCRDELERLRLTQSALLALGEEELPQRIAFVSDAVFEPRWWQRIWTSGPALGFVSALILAAAIFVHAFTRPAPIYVQQKAAVASSDIDQKVHAAVVKAVAEVEDRQKQETASLIDAAAKRFEARHRVELLAAEDTIRMYQQQMGRMLVAYNDQSRSGQ